MCLVLEPMAVSQDIKISWDPKVTIGMIFAESFEEFPLYVAAFMFKVLSQLAPVVLALLRVRSPPRPPEMFCGLRNCSHSSICNDNGWIFHRFLFFFCAGAHLPSPFIIHRHQYRLLPNNRGLSKWGRTVSEGEPCLCPSCSIRESVSSIWIRVIWNSWIRDDCHRNDSNSLFVLCRVRRPRLSQSAGEYKNIHGHASPFMGPQRRVPDAAACSARCEGSAWLKHTEHSTLVFIPGGPHLSHQTISGLVLWIWYKWDLLFMPEKPE